MANTGEPTRRTGEIHPDDGDLAAGCRHSRTCRDSTVLVEDKGVRVRREAPGFGFFRGTGNGRRLRSVVWQGDFLSSSGPGKYQQQQR